ncbi:hypothetical protein Q4566_16510 [Tamlana sp. 2_MG-2023]|uniref:tetratricopeptide repeat protein n=1 Tax=unclassified Tamlana TaxID=2614803 RepID=UPI0026E18ECC|nr:MULTISPECIES: tetratricopeptide repeat protein [unclassified Tamlana]MDO6761812.1 hypothetical protein [Tamlana sp. 2_MG-2023]MDO6792575.1 hypothetical protein [Tamlana sp. 1_MG-2023]
MKYFNFLIVLISFSSVFSQPNCEAYKYFGDTLKYEACKKAEQIKNHYQFSKKFQKILDESILIDSTFAYAYREKSVAYLKSGDFITWKKLMDKAVKFDSKDNLGYRGWCRYQFFRDYEGAIKDLEKLDNLVDYDIGHSINGTYHLNIAKGLCYKGIGEKEKAIKIIENQIKLNEKEDFVGAYDYLHLGALYLETERFEKAINVFKKQSQTNELAENQYYLALTFLKLNKPDKYKSCLEKATELYIGGRKMSDPYSNPMDKVYLKNIEDELRTAYNNDYK